MKLAARFGIGLGISSFLFATYTAVTGPALLPKANEVTRERIAEIHASLPQEDQHSGGKDNAHGGACCAKKEAAPAPANCCPPK